MMADRICDCGEGPRNIRGECTVHEPRARQSMLDAKEQDVQRDRAWKRGTTDARMVLIDVVKAWNAKERERSSVDQLLFQLQTVPIRPDEWTPGDPDPPGYIQPLTRPDECIDCGTVACDRHRLHKMPEGAPIARTKREYRKHMLLFDQVFTEVPYEGLPDE